MSSPLWPRRVCVSRFDYMDLLKQTALLWNREQKHVSGKWGQIWVVHWVHNDQRNASLWCHCTNLHTLVLLRLMNLSSSGDERVTFKYLIKLQCYLGYSLYKHVKQDSLQNVALHAMTVVTVNRTKDGDCLVSKNVDIAQNATNMDYKLMYLTNLGPYDFCHVENTDSHRIQT